MKANKTSESYYENIAPVHVDYEQLANAIAAQKGWTDTFASAYAKAASANSFAPVVVVPDYYAKMRDNAALNGNGSFAFDYAANDNAGTFSLTVSGEVDGTEQTLLSYTFAGFKRVDPADIKATYSGSSALVDKTPTELQAALDDPATADQTKAEVFAMFGIDPQYAQLPYDVKINGYDVLGHADIQLSFPTVSSGAAAATGQQSGSALLERQDATAAGSDLAFSNRFTLTAERWFIPTVAVCAAIVLAALLTALWFAWGKKAYARYAAKAKLKIEREYEALSILTEEDGSRDAAKGRNPMAFAGTEELNEHASVKARFREEAPYLNRRETDPSYERAVRKRGLSGFHERLDDAEISWGPRMALTHPISE